MTAIERPSLSLVSILRSVRSPIPCSLRFLICTSRSITNVGKSNSKKVFTKSVIRSSFLGLPDFPFSDISHRNGANGVWPPNLPCNRFKEVITAFISSALFLTNCASLRRVYVINSDGEIGRRVVLRYKFIASLSITFSSSRAVNRSQIRRKASMEACVPKLAACRSYHYSRH